MDRNPKNESIEFISFNTARQANIRTYEQVLRRIQNLLN